MVKVCPPVDSYCVVDTVGFLDKYLCTQSSPLFNLLTVEASETFKIKAMVQYFCVMCNCYHFSLLSSGEVSRSK